MTHAVLPTAPMAARIHPAAIAHYTERLAERALNTMSSTFTAVIVACT